MAIAVSSIIAKVRSELNDEDGENYRWSTSDLVGWLNSGLKAAVVHKPDINILVEPVKLSPGTRQSIPDGGVQLLDILRNMGDTGETPGESISIIDRKTLDTIYPRWHSGAGSSVVKHYVFDERYPKLFFVYPPNTGSYVEIIYGATPLVVTIGDSLPIDDIWEPTMIDYVCYRAHKKDADHPESYQNADNYFRSFLLSLGAKDGIEAISDPNRRRR